MRGRYRFLFAAAALVVGCADPGTAVVAPTHKQPAALALSYIIHPDESTPGFSDGVCFYFIGMPSATFQREFGVPESALPNTGNTTLNYEGKGVAVDVNNGIVLGITFFLRASDLTAVGSGKYSACSARTDRGISLGAGESQILAAYGTPASAERIPLVDRTVIRYGAPVNLEFALDDGKLSVVEIAVR